ncbi:MAG: hypothetical protein LBK59_03305 [Bifidobacteriaceae bacterium]|nr:hypothetical protein [Bifidobacteriaceae bacterium]
MKRKFAIFAAVTLAATMSLGATAAQAGAPILRSRPVMCGFEGTLVTPDGEPAAGVTVTVWEHEPDSEPGAWIASPADLIQEDWVGGFFAGYSSAPGPRGTFTLEFGGEGWSTVYAPGVDSPEDAEFYVVDGDCPIDLGEIVIDYAPASQ